MEILDIIQDISVDEETEGKLRKRGSKFVRYKQINRKELIDLVNSFINNGFDPITSLENVIDDFAKKCKEEKLSYITPLFGGKLSVEYYAPREARNPTTGENFLTEEKHQIKLKTKRIK